MSNVALFFGSFNPIHYGHLAVAEYVLSHHLAREVWFIVSPQNPLKSANELAPESDRLQMVRAAIEGNPQMRASDIEFSLPRPSYTAHTLQVLRKEFADHRFSILMGEDLLGKFHLWKDYSEILENHHLIVYPRPESLPASSEVDWGRYKIQRAEAAVFGVSSTLIRENCAQKISNRYLLPDAVILYIQKNSLYVQVPKNG